MSPARLRRARLGAAIVSGGVHLALLAWLAVQAPILPQRDEGSGPPEPIIPILILPRTPPLRGEIAPPAPVRLHHRPPRVREAPSPVAPLPVPPAPEPAPGPAPASSSSGPVTLHPAPFPQSPQSDLRAALRGSPVGCANQDRVGLTRAEREHCDEVMGSGAKTALFPGLGIEAGKAAAFERAGAAKLRQRRRLESPMETNTPPGDSDQPTFRPDPIAPK